VQGGRDHTDTERRTLGLEKYHQHQASHHQYTKYHSLGHKTNKISQITAKYEHKADTIQTNNNPDQPFKQQQQTSSAEAEIKPTTNQTR
jgi:hypothetical protein